ncbi:MAG: efflux RND transporter periplasmic adaptor subunit [Polyangiaceae bacterium]
MVVEDEAKKPPRAEPPPQRKRGGGLGRALKRIFVALLLLGLLAGFAATLFFLYKRSKGEPPVVKTEKPTRANIVRKAVATGSIVPRKEVFIKPRVSGILKKLYVEAGQRIAEGDLIADVKIIPDVIQLTRAEGELRSADIAMKHAESELHRAERLAEQGVMSERDLEDRRLDFDLRKAEFGAASANLQVVREGAIAKAAPAPGTKGKGEASNTEIRATVGGVVLDVPVLEGSSVIEANNFNEGTTVASVADMNDMIFVGKVDEADVGKVKVGMDVSIQIGAVENRSFDGTLEYIAAKGKLVDGAIQFEVKAALKPIEDKSVVIRAGYSANAGIVLDRKTDVLTLAEKLMQFDGDKPYVEVKSGPASFERKELKVGISDGIRIEIVEGLDESADVKVPVLGPPPPK